MLSEEGTIHGTTTMMLCSFLYTMKHLVETHRHHHDLDSNLERNGNGNSCNSFMLTSRHPYIHRYQSCCSFCVFVFPFCTIHTHSNLHRSILFNSKLGRYAWSLSRFANWQSSWWFLGR
jgi:hypothetical protein